jgi:hypothetical protein
LKFHCTVCLLLLILCAPILADAQSTDATISGVVVDPSGKVIPEADIEVLNEATGVHYSSKTNGTGIYSITILPPGQYVIQVSKVGFKTLIKPDIVLNVQSAVALNFTLPVGPSSESITVEAGASAINTTDGSVSTVIDRDFVENMPLNGRSFQELLTLAPGVAQVTTSAGLGYSVGYSGDIVVNGQRTESNYFTVDGVSANTGAQSSGAEGAGVSGSLPIFTALGTTHGLASIDDLEEFRSNTSTYSAEYGRTPGGQFSFNTRSGTNVLHGSLYDYFRNDALDANNWFNDFYAYPKGKERQNDFGGTLGGPVVVPGIYDGKNKTFFFFSYEGLRLASPQAATQVAVPEASLRQQAPSALQPLLSAFPDENDGSDGLNDGFGYYLESVSYPSNLNNTSIRFDRVVGKHLTIFGRYADTPSASTTYSGAVQQGVSSRTQSTTLGATLALAAHQSNEFRFNFTRSKGRSATVSTDLGGATAFDLSSLSGPGGGSFPQENSVLYASFEFGAYPSFVLDTFPQTQNQINLTDTHNWTLGNHNIKVGMDWRTITTTLLSENPAEEIGFFNESQVLQNSTGFAFVSTAGLTSDNKPVYGNFSSFLQDEWRVTPQLSISSGVRWDINPAPSNANGPVPYNVTEVSDLATTQLAPKGTPLWRTDWLGFAPRIGVAFQTNPQSSLNTVIRAGFGAFYDTGNALGSQGYNGIGFSSSAQLSSASFPLSSSQLTLPAPSTATPYSGYIYGYDPNLRLPYSLQYNVAVEQALGKRDSLTLGYVGSGGRKLLTAFVTSPGEIGNPNFAPTGHLNVTQGRASSSYNSLQVKYQRQLSQGLQTLVSYTYAHSIDNASSNFGVYYLLRASSDFDIRENLQAAVTYLTPRMKYSSLIAYLLNDWGFDSRFQTRAALPVDVIGNQQLDPGTGTYLQYQPNLVSDQPLYLHGRSYPGGRIINYNAFQTAPAGVQGNLPRNYANGFGLVQLDTAVRREIPIHDTLHIQLRVEAFNILNHPMFGPIYNYLSYGPGLFGTAFNTANTTGNLNSLYQVGGPRSLQLSLRLLF